jgi:hypothetical protein
MDKSPCPCRLELRPRGPKLRLYGLERVRMDASWVRSDVGLAGMDVGRVHADAGKQK